MRVRDLQKLVEGDEVKFSDYYKEFFLEEAWNMNIVGGFLKTKEHADSYFLWKAIGAGFPYTAKFIRYNPDVGRSEGIEPMPGALVLYEVAGVKMTSYIGHRDIHLVKKTVAA